MALKMESAQIPGWGKNEKNDKDFEDELDGLEKEMPAYIRLKEKYIQEAQTIEKLKKDLAASEAAGSISSEDRMTSLNMINFQEGELEKMRNRILPLAGKISKLVVDPRYSDLRFLNIYDDGTVDDPVENISQEEK